MEQIILKFKIRLLSIVILLKKIISIYLLPKAFIKARYIRFLSDNNNACVIILYQHIGDLICAEPLSSYLKNYNNHNKKIIWIVNNKFAELLTLFKDVDVVVPVSSVSEIVYINLFLSGIEVHNLHFDGLRCQKYELVLKNSNKICNYHNYMYYGSLIECFSVTGGLPRLKMKPSLNLNKKSTFQVPQMPYIAFQTEAREELRRWSKDKWVKFLSDYSDYQFLEVSLKPNYAFLPNCNSNYCGKLSLVDIAYLIKGASLYIGIDSSVAHYANALGKKSLILLGDYHGSKDYVPFVVDNENFKILRSENKVADISVEEVKAVFETMLKN